MRRDIMLDQLPVQRRSRVFISGTYDDLKDVRKEVEDVLKRIGEDPLEPHYTGGSNEDIRDKVGRQIKYDADLYAGVFGTRYGTRVSSEPDAVSYSEFEYKNALEKWGSQRPPPIAVFVPDKVNGQAFYGEIEAKCNEALKDVCRGDEELIAEDKRRQDAFLEFVRRPNGDPRLGNKIIQPVTSRGDLREAVIAWIKLYKGDTLFLWVHERVLGPPRQVEPDPAKWSLQLGQVERVCDLLGRASATRYVPGICLLVRGARSHDQSVLASLIAQPKYWDNELDPFYRELESFDSDSEQAIWKTLWRAAGPHPPGAWDDADELAKELLEADQPLVVVMRQVQLLKGRVRGFAERIWQPVYDSLLKASQGRAPDSLNTRLIVIVTYEGGDFELENEIGCNADSLPDDVNFRKIVNLTKVP